MRSANASIGRVFQRRDKAKAILVEKDAYLLELARCVILYPVPVGMVAQPEAWRQFRRSSDGRASLDIMY